MRLENGRPEGELFTPYHYNAVRRPEPFRIVLFYIKMLTMDSIKHIFNSSIYRTVAEKKYLITLFIQCRY